MLGKHAPQQQARKSHGSWKRSEFRCVEESYTSTSIQWRTRKHRNPQRLLYKSCFLHFVGNIIPLVSPMKQEEKTALSDTNQPIRVRTKPWNGREGHDIDSVCRNHEKHQDLEAQVRPEPRNDQRNCFDGSVFLFKNKHGSLKWGFCCFYAILETIFLSEDKSRCDDVTGKKEWAFFLTFSKNKWKKINNSSLSNSYLQRQTITAGLIRFLRL